MRAGQSRLVSILVLAAMGACGGEKALPSDAADVVAKGLDLRNSAPLLPSPAFAERRSGRDFLFHASAVSREAPPARRGWERHDLLGEVFLKRMQSASPWSPAVIPMKSGGRELLFDLPEGLPMGFCLPVGRIDGGFRLIVRATILEPLQWNASFRFSFRQTSALIRTVRASPPPYPFASVRGGFSLGGGGDGHRGGYTHGVELAWRGLPAGGNVLDELGWQPGRTYLWDMEVGEDADGWFMAGMARDALDGRVIVRTRRYEISEASRPSDDPWSFHLLPRGPAPSLAVVMDGLWLDTRAPLDEVPDAVPEDPAWARNARWARGVFRPEDDDVVAEAGPGRFDDLGCLLWARLRFDGDTQATREAARRFFSLLSAAMVKETERVNALQREGKTHEEEDARKARLFDWLDHMFPRLRRSILMSDTWRDPALAEDLRTLSGYLPNFKAGVLLDAYDLRDLALALEGR